MDSAAASPAPVAVQASTRGNWSELLDHLPDAVFIVAANGASGQILYANLQAACMFGYPPGELPGRSIDALVPANLVARHAQRREAYAQAPALRAMGAGLRLQGCRRDGTQFPIDVMLNGTEVDGALAIVAIARDLTERARLESALTEARDSAVRANIVKSRFLAAASHDLRQPLQTIWSLHSVLARTLTGSEVAPQLALLEESVRTMDQILASLIDINRLEQGSIVPEARDFALQEILPRLRSEFGYAASSKSLRLELADSSEYARSDPMLLMVILRNLLGNAIKYTTRGSVRLEVQVQDSNLRLAVTDTGPGIAPEHLTRLFDAFYQVDNPSRDQRRGVGLGLSIVQMICRLLGHEVAIDTRVGVGSTFSVTLPRGVCAPRPLAPATVTAPRPALPLQRPRVLHIEDDPGVAQSMAMLLRLEGYEVLSVCSRAEALQQLRLPGPGPDLILCDYQLPMGFTGDEIVSELAGLLGHKPPTIMLTGDIADRHLERARRVAERILPKPVAIDLLLREMATLLATRH
jgi:PAS domain S-box-containing protein